VGADGQLLAADGGVAAAAAAAAAAQGVATGETVAAGAPLPPPALQGLPDDVEERAAKRPRQEGEEVASGGERHADKV
jgi:hypothetical protein